MTLSKKQVIERVNDAFARGDVEEFLSYCADDMAWTMVGSEPLRGKEAIRNWMASAPAEPPQFTVEHVVADGDIVTAVGDMTMTENGADVPYAYCDVWTFRGDKIVELRAFVIKTQAVAAQSR